MTAPGFGGGRVLTLESRRSAELGALIKTFGGRPVAAPALREVALEANMEAAAWADALIRGELDIVVFLTGVGARTLLDLAERRYPQQDIQTALTKVRLAARGPKPMAVLRERGLAPWVSAPEPNTWRELLAALDGATPAGLGGQRVAVQEYGSPSPELIAGLESRGATVWQVPVYRWALPDDLGPLRSGVQALADGTIDVVLWTTGVQVAHVLQVAKDVGETAAVKDGLERVAVCSIGPLTTLALSQAGIVVDMEPSHPKMGYLVREAAGQCLEILARKRRKPGTREGRDA